MKAIYKKPETEVVYLQVKEDITWGELQRVSNKNNVVTTNDGFFDDNTNEKDPFFDD